MYPLLTIVSFLQPQLTDEFRARLRTALTEYNDVLKMKELGDGSVELREVEETVDATGQS